MTNLYTNTAWLYDIDNRDNLSSDIPFYIDYATQQDGEILELGCGTGRVAIALAKAGHRITALDLSKEMLDVFRTKIDSQVNLKNKITLVHGSMADFNFNHKFSMIIAPFRAFQALVKDDDIEISLRCIHSHLTANGIFIINMFNPYTIMDENWCYPETVQWERFDDKTGNHVIKKHWGDKIDTVNQIIYPHYAYEVTENNGVKSRYIEDLSLKYYYENQIAERLEKAGFTIKEKFGWYDKSSIENARRELIFVCGRK